MIKKGKIFTALQVKRKKLLRSAEKQERSSRKELSFDRKMEYESYDSGSDKPKTSNERSQKKKLELELKKDKEKEEQRREKLENEDKKN